MAIRLTFDVLGATCGDLLRFADVVRAAGAQPGYPLQQSAGPHSIEVVVDDQAGPATYPYPAQPQGPGPVPRPGPMRPPPQFRQPHPYEQPGFHVLSGGQLHPGDGCTIDIHHHGTSRGTHVPIGTVDRWRAALDTVLGAGQLDESTRASLRHLREIFESGGGGS